MSRLRTASNLQGPDDFYQALIEAHRGLTDEQSMALNARLVLLLANHIGDLEVLREALRLAREERDSDKPALTAEDAEDAEEN